MSDPLTFDEAVARVVSGGIVWDDELPESMRGFGVPSLLRFDPPRSERARRGEARARSVDDLREQHYDRFVGDER